MKIEKKITLSWIEKEIRKTGRVNAMYCFHSCDLNRN